MNKLIMAVLILSRLKQIIKILIRVKYIIHVRFGIKTEKYNYNLIVSEVKKK